jgi:hypothetical protein
MEICKEKEPAFVDIGELHWVACFLHSDEVF